jgi:hypothetical protein
MEKTIKLFLSCVEVNHQRRSLKIITTVLVSFSPIIVDAPTQFIKMVRNLVDVKTLIMKLQGWG